MQVGIYTRYHHCEATYAALDIAAALRLSAHRVTMMRFTAGGVAVSRYWDSRVKPEFEPEDFFRWSCGLGTIIWTHCPRAARLEACRERGIRNILVACWSELADLTADDLRACDLVVAPHRCVFEGLQASAVVREAKARIALCPWFPAGAIRYELPPHSREGVGIFVIPATLPRRFLFECLQLPNIAIVSGSRLPHCLRKKAINYNHEVPYEDLAEVLGRHVAIIYLPGWADFGQVPWLCHYVGTECAAFTIPPLSDVPGVVGIPCERRVDVAGWVAAVPDHAAMLRAITGLSGLRGQGIGEAVADSRQLFCNIWQEIVGTPIDGTSLRN